MRYVIEFVDKEKAAKIVGGLRLEIDYELVTLFDALEVKDDYKIKVTKEKLKKLVRELEAISVYIRND